MTRRRDRGHERVPELDHLAVGERDVLELDARAGGQVGGRAGALDERGQAGDVVGLHVRLEHSHDRGAERLGGREVVVDEVGVRVDDGELAVRACSRTGSSRRSRASFRKGRSSIGASSQLAISTGEAGAAPLGKADVEPPRLAAVAAAAAGRRRRRRRSRGRGSRRRSRAAAAARRDRLERRRAAPRARRRCAPRRYSASGRTSSTTTSPRAEPLAQLARRQLLDPVALAQVVVGKHVHLGDVPRRDVAHRRPELADPVARKPVDDPLALAARAHEARHARAPADAARCSRRSARSRRRSPRPNALPARARRRSPPAGRSQRLRDRRERVEQRRLRRSARHTFKLSLDFLSSKP